MSEICISCEKNQVTWPRICDTCQDKEAQAELAAYYYENGENPDDWRCNSCGMIYDGGMRCTYCGEEDPLDQGNIEELLEFDE